MSLIKYGIAAALGYYFGQPQGRKQLQQLRQQVIQLSQRPQVKQLQASARERALAAKDRAATTMARKKESADPTPVDPTPLGDTAPISTPEPARTDSAPTGFGGRTVAEDSEAARTGLVPPPPPGRTTPPSSAPRP
jgi:hypothetical protein